MPKFGTDIGEADELAQDVQGFKREEKGLIESLAAETGNSTRRVRSALKRKQWMSAGEALKFGLIDEVLEGRAYAPKP